MRTKYSKTLLHFLFVPVSPSAISSGIWKQICITTTTTTIYQTTCTYWIATRDEEEMLPRKQKKKHIMKE